MIDLTLIYPHHFPCLVIAYYPLVSFFTLFFCLSLYSIFPLSDLAITRCSQAPLSLMSRPIDLSMSSVKNPSPLAPGGTGGFTPVFEASPANSPAGSRRPSISQPLARRPSEVSVSRRPSVNHQYSSYASQYPQQGGQSLSRRSSMASGPRPIRRGEYSGPATPSVLSRAGSPTLPLGNEFTQAPRSYFEGASSYTPLGGTRELRNGQFIGSLDCGTT